MTPQESQMLNDLIRRVQSTQVGQKDPEAEQLLAEGLANDPDAVYILAQTVLVQDLALRQARAQIDQLRQQQQQQAAAPARPTSFLGSLLHREPPPPSPVTPQQPPQYQAQPQYQPVSYGQPQYGGQPQYQQGPPYGQGPVFQQGPGFGEPSFLRSAATTAAGVAAGALAFEGIESLLHGGHGGYGGWGGYGGGMPMGMPMGGGMGGRPEEETIINNYYDSPGGSEHREGGGHETGGFGSGDSSDALREHHEHEANFDERPGDASHDSLPDSPHMEQASYDPSGDVAYDDRQTQDLGGLGGDGLGNDQGYGGDGGAQFEDASLQDDSGFDGGGGDFGGDDGSSGGNDLA